MKYIFTLIWCILITPLMAQESIIKDFAESRKEMKFCFYPSTLRMINIKNDPAYNELVSDVEKLLIYRLDSSTSVSRESMNWTKEYQENGFEEYISMKGAIDLVLLGKEEEFVGISGTGQKMVAFYLRGQIALQKIPELIRTFESGDILSLITDQMK